MRALTKLCLVSWAGIWVVLAISRIGDHFEAGTYTWNLPIMILVFILISARIGFLIAKETLTDDEKDFGHRSRSELIAEIRQLADEKKAADIERKRVKCPAKKMVEVTINPSRVVQ